MSAHKIKIGILNYHSGINYGAFLQCYALYSLTADQGLDVQVINYKNIRHWFLEYRYFLFRINPRIFFSNIQKIRNFKKLLKQMALTKFTWSISSLKHKKYDYIIATGYQKIISNQILSKAKIKALNIHPGSIYNPGAGCYSYPIFNKEKFSGVTCHELSAKPDTGTVLIEKRFILYSNDDFTSLQGRTLVTVLQIFYEIMDIIIQKKKFPISKNQWKRKPRYQKNYINDLLNINLKRDTKNIIQLKIRSANPSYPGPYVDIDGVKKTVRIINGKLKVVDKKFVKSFKYGK